MSGILTITHSQWIYRNVSYHDKQNGYAKRTKIEELNYKILQLSQTSPREVPQDCLFLLERDESGHEDETVQAKGYYVAAMEAAIKAGRRMAAMGRRARKARKGIRRFLRQSERLGVFRMDKEVRATIGPSRKGTLDSFCGVRKRVEPRGATVRGRMRLMKRFKPGD